ncbi:MAG: hypothetical protein KJO36_00410, partial [Acidimicrobiia bacterium]|nr:hypothetical protein [Acidimicrobiia bacterium]
GVDTTHPYVIDRKISNNILRLKDSPSTADPEVDLTGLAGDITVTTETLMDASVRESNAFFQTQQESTGPPPMPWVLMPGYTFLESEGRSQGYGDFTITKQQFIEEIKKAADHTITEFIVWFDSATDTAANWTDLDDAVLELNSASIQEAAAAPAGVSTDDDRIAALTWGHPATGLLAIPDGQITFVDWWNLGASYAVTTSDVGDSAPERCVFFLTAADQTFENEIAVDQTTLVTVAADQTFTSDIAADQTVLMTVAADQTIEMATQ